MWRPENEITPFAILTFRRVGPFVFIRMAMSLDDNAQFFPTTNEATNNEVDFACTPWNSTAAALGETMEGFVYADQSNCFPAAFRPTWSSGIMQFPLNFYVDNVGMRSFYLGMCSLNGLCGVGGAWISLVKLGTDYQAMVVGDGIGVLDNSFDNRIVGSYML